MVSMTKAVSELHVTDDNEPLSFALLAAATANVMEWLRQEAGRIERDADDEQNEIRDDECDDGERAHGLAGASMQHDDDGEDRNCEAERESDLHAGRKVVATAHGLKPFACLAM